MAGLYDQKIDKSVDWGGDASTGYASVTGRRVQEFIKEQLEHRAGVFYYDSANNRYLIFADETNRDEYLADTSRVDLLIGAFDAPSNYEAKISLKTSNFNAVLYGSTGNYVEFTFDTVNKDGESVGESVTCTYTFVRGGTKKVVTEKYRYGTSVRFNVDEYLEEGSNSITIGIVGDTTLAATTVGVTYQVVNLSLSSSYDISTVQNLYTNPSAVAEIPYTVTGTGTKTMEWYLDGKQLGYESTDEIVEVTGTRTKYISMSGLQQGAHSIQARAYVTVNGEKFYSNVLYMDAIVYTAANRDPIIALAAEIPAEYGITTGALKIYGVEQYTPYTFKFAVYNATGAATTQATISVGGVVQGTVDTTNGTVYPYTIRVNTVGTTTLKVMAGITSYEASMEVGESSADIGENNNNLVLDLYAIGRTNEDSNREQWVFNNYKTTFNGFKWNATSGWVDNRLVISDGASIEVNIAPFAGAATTTGLTVEMELATDNVNDDDAVVCDLRSSNGKGMLLTASTAQITSTGDAKVSTKYKSGENIRVAFVINPATGVTNKGLVFIYVDGILSGAARFAENDNFISDTLLKVGGTVDATVKLKHIRIYNAALSSDDVLNNYILYRDTSEEMMSAYNRNNILDGREFDLDALASQCPVLKVTGDIPTLENTTSKDETIYVDVEYVNMQDPTRSFTGKYLRMRPQGTSSMGYPKKNFRLYTDKHDNSRIYDYQGKEIVDRLYSFTEGAQPVGCWCFKADYAESSGTHNTGIARLWNKVMYDAQVGGEYVLRTDAQKIALSKGYKYDVRTTVDGFPCHIVYRLDENSDWIYIGKYNFNNDKSTESVFGFTGIPGFDNSRMQCWEVRENSHHLALFEDTTNFDTEWTDAYEARYPDAGSSADTTDLKAFCEWVVSTKGNLAKFKNEKWEHLDVYKAAAYYIYVMRFGAVDQTVKNSMLTSEDGEHFYWINYDNDTINGLRNDGLLAFDFTIDRQSFDPTFEEDVYVYAGHNSTLWNNMEADDEFMAVVAQVDQALYTAGLTYADAIDMFDAKQSSKWCERVYNQDAQYKYIGPYTDKGTNNLFMLQGARRSHRRWWLSHRFDLIDSMFISGKYKANVIDFKVMNDTPKGQSFKIVAGNLLYYGYGINDIPVEIGVRLDKGDEYTFTTVKNFSIGDPVRIYSAPNIRSLDLSPMMTRLTELGVSGVYTEENGSQLKSLIIGNGTSTNSGLAEISGLAQAKVLENLDIRGCLGLTAVSIEGIKSLVSFKAQNSGLKSFIPAEGALLSEVYLPNGLTGMTLRSLAYLDELNVENAGKNLSTIQISNCPSLTSSFTFFENWYNNKSAANRLCTVELDNVLWEGLTAQQLIDFGQIIVDGGTLKLKGKAVITESSDEIVQQLSAIYGENVFNSTSEFYISAPSAIYLTGPDEILEGGSGQYIAAVFGENQGTIEWSIVSGDTTNQSIDQYGLLTTKYVGSARTVTIQAKHYPTSGAIVTMTKDVKIIKQIRPTGGTVSGPDAAYDGAEYTLTASPGNINTSYSVSWSLAGEAYDAGYASIKSQEDGKCSLTIASGAKGNLTVKATITDVGGNTIVATKDVILGVILTMKIASNQSNDTSLNSVKVTVVAGSETYSMANGDSVPLASGTLVKATFPSVDGYATPTMQEVVMGDENYTITGTYSTTIVTVTMADNQSAYNDISGATATVSASGMTTKTLSSGGTAKVPTGAECTVKWSSVTGYKTPDTQTFTASGTSRTAMGTYTTCILTVNVVFSEVEQSAFTITVKDTTSGSTLGTQTTTSAVYKVPMGNGYSITGSEIDGAEGAAVTGTASSASKTETFTYATAKSPVMIAHKDGNVYTTGQWSSGGFSNDDAEGVAVIGEDGHAFIIAKTDASESALAWGGYNKNISGIVTNTSSSNAVLDMDGIGNTPKIIKQCAGYTDSSYNITGAPAAEACAAYTFPSGKKGYLPALGEWKGAYNNKTAVVSAMALIGGTAIQSNYYWSSTQSSSNRSWSLSWSYGYLNYDGKGTSYYVRAFAPLSYISLKATRDTTFTISYTNVYDEQVTATSGIGGVSLAIKQGTEVTVTPAAVDGVTADAKTFTWSGFRKSLYFVFSEDAGVFIQHVTTGELFTEAEWTAGGYGNDAANGVAVLSPTAGAFVIAKEDASSSTLQWGGYGKTITDIVTTTSSATAVLDYDGIGNTPKIIEQCAGYTSQSITGVPAAEACAAYTFPSGQKGYLPALGEWKGACNNKTAVVSAMTLIGGTAIKSDYYWSSTQYNSTYSWYLGWFNGALYNHTKNLDYSVRAFAAL